jgi:2-polyprenyl-6-methoxyphenol hydroxylase-like FAD-dependent oxidoreductase
MESYDAVVVGGGPAGASAAHVLAQGGARVLLLEKATIPRYKPCGGGITARARAASEAYRAAGFCCSAAISCLWPAAARGAHVGGCCWRGMQRHWPTP